MEKKLEDRTVLVVLRQGTATPHGDHAQPQAKEIVSGVAKWTMNSSECLELYGVSNELVATFRDWTFIKFLESKNGAA